MMQSPAAHQAFLRQQSVLYAHLTHIEKVYNLVLVCKVSGLERELCRLDILAWRKVVQNDGDLVPSNTFVKPAFSNSVMATGVVTSFPSTKSNFASMRSPALTDGRPACAARIFCVIVIPMDHSPS